jgi:hypothetical protein
MPQSFVSNSFDTIDIFTLQLFQGLCILPPKFKQYWSILASNVSICCPSSILSAELEYRTAQIPATSCLSAPSIELDRSPRLWRSGSWKSTIKFYCCDALYCIDLIYFWICFYFFDETTCCGCWLLKCQCLHSTKLVLAGCLLWKETNQFKVCIFYCVSSACSCDPSRIGSLQRRHIQHVRGKPGYSVSRLALMRNNLLHHNNWSLLPFPPPDERVTGICSCIYCQIR